MRIPFLSNGLGSLIAALTMPMFVHYRLVRYKLFLFLANVDEGNILLCDEVRRM